MIASIRRSTELGLVLMAAVITGAAYALSALGRTANLPADIGPFLGVILGLLLLAHVAVRRLARGADGLLLPIAALLNGLGYVFIARIDSQLASKQATWTMVGIGAFVLTLMFVRKVRDLSRYQWTLALGGIVLLLLPILPGLGSRINGSRIWVRIGPVSFQPGEFAKIALALFFAAYLTEHREVLRTGTWHIGPFSLPQPRDLLPVAAAWMVCVLVMVSQADLGSALLFFTLFVVMLWIATERMAYLGLGFGLFALGAYLAWQSVTRVQQRVSIWLDPWSDPQKNGYQLIQGLFALAWGGTSGTGLGLGDPRRVPAAHNDFIIAAIGEELGLLGTSAIVISYLLMVGSGLRIAARADGPFEKLLAIGLTTILGVQAFIIMGGVTRLLPLTGVTLPFVSYGGSSLVANYVLLALLLRISDDTAQRTGEVEKKVTRRERRAARRADTQAARAGATGVAA